MSDFLLELRSEEIPARMQAKARNDLARLFAQATEAAGLKTGAIDTQSTPRRLVLVARDVAASTDSVREEIKGPRSSAPPQALEGFLRKTGLTNDQLEDRDGIYFASIERAGRPAAEILADAVKQIIAEFPWAKSMRWGSGTMRWVRPLQGIVAMLGEDIVPVEIEGIHSGATTLGHRFHHPGPITLGGAHDYAEKLRACHVIVDQEEREAIIRDAAAAAALAAGCTLVVDEGLVVENAGLTEWPVPLLGRFDGDFLDVPREVIVLTMRTNQKYFACTGDDGALAPAFVCVANIAANDGGEAIVKGHRRVLAARLSDARFFWEQDLKVPLEEQAKKLDGIVFHEKLGTLADKVDRVAKLARWLVEQGIVTSPLPQAGGAGGGPAHSTSDTPTPNPSRAREGNLADQAERAARLAKADLVTGMVGEFPELQGVIGGYLAAAQGEPKAVADAIRDHYKPVGQGDKVPTAPVTVAVSLADKLDTIASFFGINERPSGSKDPFALRRAALATVSLILQNGLRVSLASTSLNAVLPIVTRFMNQVIVALKVGESQEELLETNFEDVLKDDQSPENLARLIEIVKNSRAHDPVQAAENLEFFTRQSTPRLVAESIVEFLAERLKVQQREAGVRHDLIDAVFALGGEDDLVRLLSCVRALQSFVETGEGADLLTAHKRAANILKKENSHESAHAEPVEATADALRQAQGERDFQPAEAALTAALDAAEPTASTAIEAEDFTRAMTALASLRAPIDAFFEQVKVNDPDPAKRERRLALLARFRDAVNRVADFSKIEG